MADETNNKSWLSLFSFDFIQIFILWFSTSFTHREMKLVPDFCCCIWFELIVQVLHQLLVGEKQHNSHTIHHLFYHFPVCDSSLLWINVWPPRPSKEAVWQTVSGCRFEGQPGAPEARIPSDTAACDPWRRWSESPWTEATCLLWLCCLLFPRWKQIKQKQLKMSCFFCVFWGVFMDPWFWGFQACRHSLSIRLVI